ARRWGGGSGGNVAARPAPIDGKVKPIAPFDSDNTNPAGGINSSAEDMAEWLRVQLSGGTLADGSRLFSEATARQLTTIVTPMPIGNPPPELSSLKTNFRGSALGWTFATTAATSSSRTPAVSPATPH